MIFAGYTGSKNPVQNGLKFQFIELDFSNLIFQKTKYRWIGRLYLKKMNGSPAHNGVKEILYTISEILYAATAGTTYVYD